MAIVEIVYESQMTVQIEFYVRLYCEKISLERLNAIV